MKDMYDRDEVDSVLRRAGMPDDRRAALLSEIRFPIPRDALQDILAPLGITHDGLISRMGGSP
jgi:hypothetical protein